jgi:hypothetical protein
MVDEPVELVKAVVQPATSNAAAVNETNAIGKDLTSVLEFITITPLSALEPFGAVWSTNAEPANSLASRTSDIAGLLCRERGAQNWPARLPAISERTWAKCHWARSGGTVGRNNRCGMAGRSIQQEARIESLPAIRFGNTPIPEKLRGSVFIS